MTKRPDWYVRPVRLLRDIGRSDANIRELLVALNSISPSCWTYCSCGGHLRRWRRRRAKEGRCVRMRRRTWQARLVYDGHHRDAPLVERVIRKGEGVLWHVQFHRRPCRRKGWRFVGHFLLVGGRPWHTPVTPRVVARRLLDLLPGRAQQRAARLRLGWRREQKLGLAWDRWLAAERGPMRRRGRHRWLRVEDHETCRRVASHCAHRWAKRRKSQ